MTVRVEWLSTAELDAIYAEALSILESVGMRMKGAAVLDVLRDAGAAVDETGVVRFPAELVERAVAACPRDLLMAGETPEQDVVLDGSRTFFNVSGCAAKTLDGDTGLVRPSTLKDLRDGTIVLDATPELDVVWTFLTATDVPLERRELVEYYTYLTETAKPIVFVDCPTRREPRAAHLRDRVRRPRALPRAAAHVAPLRGAVAARGQRRAAGRGRRVRLPGGADLGVLDAHLRSHGADHAGRHPGAPVGGGAGHHHGHRDGRPRRPGARLLRPRHPGHALHHDVAGQPGEHAHGRRVHGAGPSPGHPGPQLRPCPPTPSTAASRPATRRASS